MKHLGLLLACEHYPSVRPKAEKIDSQLRAWLFDAGHPVSSISVFETYAGTLPPKVGVCDAWIVSGAHLGSILPCADHYGKLLQFLKGAVACELPVFGLYHGEHVLHAALAEPAAKAPTSRTFPLSIRNPFDSFRQKDRLFRYDPKSRLVQELERPAILTIDGMLKRNHCAA